MRHIPAGGTIIRSAIIFVQAILIFSCHDDRVYCNGWCNNTTLEAEVIFAFPFNGISEVCFPSSQQFLADSLERINDGCVILNFFCDLRIHEGIL